MGWHFKSKWDGDDRYYVRYGNNRLAGNMTYEGEAAACRSAVLDSQREGTAEVLLNGEVVARFVNGRRVVR